MQKTITNNITLLLKFTIFGLFVIAILILIMFILYGIITRYIIKNFKIILENLGIHCITDNYLHC